MPDQKLPQRPHSQKLVALIEKYANVFEPEDLHLISAAAQTALRLEAGQGFHADASISLRDGKPCVDCTWMGMLASITPSQARAIALGLVQTAAEAENDAALLQFFRDSGLPDEKAAAGIVAVRNRRQPPEEIVGERQEPASDLTNVIPFGSKPS